MAEQETKKWYQSLTIWGTAILTICALILPLFGKVDLANALSTEQGNIVDALSALGALIGSVLAIIGRIRASTKLTT